MKLEFHPQAELELIEAAEYYEQQVLGLGLRFQTEVRRATEVLLDNPQLGAPAGPIFRRLTLNRFPFTLYYTVTSAALRIEVVAHQSRRPGYWKSRFSE